MIGGGYVGLVSAACFSEFGLNVNVVENNPERLSALKASQIPIYEPGLDILVANNMKAGRLSFSSDISQAIQGSCAIFIAVGTPPRNGDGHADLTYVYKAAEEIALAMTEYAIIVTKSTVPLGTSRKIAELVRSIRPDLEFDVASNPEFLREGNAISDFMRPDRVIIGTETHDPARVKKVREILGGLYNSMAAINVPIVFTNLESSELTKYAANSFLAMKVSFINEMADLCEKVGANVDDVSLGLGLDQRIGKRFLQPGPGFGGSCFPKDTLALMRIAQQYHTPSRLMEATVQYNDSRKSDMGTRIISLCDNSVRGKTIAILGLAFKPETDDMREAPSIPILHRLVEEGAFLRVFDPAAHKTARALLPSRNITYAENAVDAATGADALVVLTEWNEFRTLSAATFKKHMQGNTLIDLRNIYDPKSMCEAGLNYHSLGRPLPLNS